MPLVVHKYQSIAELQMALQGAIIGADISKGILGLVGLTVTFTSPSFSVTFASPGGGEQLLKFQDIKTQIELASALVIVKAINNRLAIMEKTPTNGINLGSAGAEPARALLGFDGKAGGHAIGKVYASPQSGSPPTAPYLVQVYCCADNSHCAVVQE